MQTIWEWAGADSDLVDAVPPTEDALLDSGSTPPSRGRLWLRPAGILPLRLFGRRAFLPRFAVLLPANGVASGPPRLQLFLTELMEQLTEELVLFSPLQLHCLPPEGPHIRFSLCANNAPPIELAADSEEERQRWMFALGSPLGGRVQLGRSKVADNYSMGKVLAQGEDYMVVEGFNVRTNRSHALKLLAKSSTRLTRRGWLHGEGRRGGPRACSQLLTQCLDEVYEGSNHVCMVMHWGTHELDSHHELASAVLEALRLLHELLPSEAPEDGLMLRAEDTQRLILRLLALDCHLQAHLFI